MTKRPIANNCRVLTPEELIFINNKYKFWIENDDVCVQCVNIARVTKHPKTEKFSINVKKVRKLTYTTTAINMFEDFQKDDKLKKYSLTDIQNTLNILRVTYQKMTVPNVLNLLNKK